MRISEKRNGPALSNAADRRALCSAVGVRVHSLRCSLRTARGPNTVEPYIYKRSEPHMR